MAVNHLDMNGLEAGIDYILDTPDDKGLVHMIVTVSYTHLPLPPIYSV